MQTEQVNCDHNNSLVSVSQSIVSNAEADAAKSGVQCRIVMSQMAYCDFLEKYDH